jgi:hypothetical protein
MSKQILVFQYYGNGYKIYDGIREQTVDDMTEYYEKYSCFVLNKMRETTRTLKEYYEYINKCHKELYKASNKAIDIKKSGIFSKTAVWYWETVGFTKDTEAVPEPLSEFEKKRTKKCKGAIIFGSKYKGEGHLYDFVSYYPSILNEETFLIPFKQPIPYEIKSLNDAIHFEKLKYGFYRCVITRSGDEMIDRLFRFDPENEYTHIDVMMAKRLKLKIRLIKDGKPNMYYYDRDMLVTARQIFGPFILKMFELKEKKVAGAKDIINALWGAICQTTRVFKPKGNEQVRNIIHEGGDKVVYTNDEFASDWARIKPFLLARGREKIVKAILPFNDKVVRLHTDGFITSEKMGIKGGVGLGEIKYEGFHKNIEVVNANRVKKDELQKADLSEAEDYRKTEIEFEQYLKTLKG